MKRFPDYHRPEANADWYRSTPREFPKHDPRYRLDPLPEPPCERLWRAVELGLAVAGWLGMAGFVAMLVRFVWWGG